MHLQPESHDFSRWECVKTVGTIASAVVSIGLAGIRIKLVSLSRRDVEEAVASVNTEKWHILLFALLQTVSIICASCYEMCPGNVQLVKAALCAQIQCIMNAVLVLDSLVFIEKFWRRARSSLSPDAEFRYFSEECYRDILDAASSEISEKLKERYRVSERDVRTFVEERLSDAAFFRFFGEVLEMCTCLLLIPAILFGRLVGYVLVSVLFGISALAIWEARKARKFKKRQSQRE